MGFNLDFDLVKSISMIAAFIVAIVGHEIMHGFVAYKYGDNTAKSQGRLSPNPVVHIDMVGSILLPGALFLLNAPFLFGWAKPVPINVSTVVRNGGYNGAIHVSLAGVTYNFGLAFFAAFLLMVVDESFIGQFLTLFLTYTVIYNVVLGYFNLLPIPTLDGAHAVEYLAIKNGAYSFAQKLQSMERYGMIFLILFIATPLSRVAFIPAFELINYLLG